MSIIKPNTSDSMTIKLVTALIGQRKTHTFICNADIVQTFYIDFSQISFVFLIALFAWAGLIRRGDLPDTPEQDWSGWEICLICLSRIDQAWMVRLICLIRINQAKSLARFAWARLIRLGRGAWFAWAEFLILLKIIWRIFEPDQFCSGNQAIRQTIRIFENL